MAVDAVLCVNEPATVGGGVIDALALGGSCLSSKNRG
jgi:hypothetical protein